MTFQRPDGRKADELRQTQLDYHFQRFPEGSVLYRCGKTTVLVSASIDESVPDWLRGSGKGWVTAEYAMHPRANRERKSRDSRRGRIDGRTQEIQRLIGRALRGAVHLKRLGERQITIDCDVLDADGGTRTASITAGFVALAMAISKLKQRGSVRKGVLARQIAAISVGLVGKDKLLDLCYQEDSAAEVDLNVVAGGESQLVEVQGTAEGQPIARRDFDTLLDLALGAMPVLQRVQRESLAAADVDLASLIDA